MNYPIKLLIPHRNYTRGADEVHEIYLANLLSSIGKGIVSVFLPILLLGIGYQLTQIATYFLIFYCLKFLFHRYTGYRLISKLGIKKSLSLAFALEALGYVTIALSSNELSIGILALSLIVLPAAEALHSDTIHLDLLEFMDSKHESAQVGFMYVLLLIGGVGGPLIAGFSAELFGPATALWLGASLLVFSGIPLFLTRDVYPDIPEIKEPSKVKFRYRLANYANNFESNTSMLIWPIFIYLLLDGNFSSTGIFFSAGFMVSAIGVVVLAKASDKKDKHKDKIMVSMSFMRSATHLLRIVSVNTPLAVFTNTFGELGSMQKPSSFGVRFYDHGRETKGSMSYIRSIEQAADIGRLSSWAIFLIALIAIQDWAFQSVFIAAAAVSPLMLYMRNK